jgi:TPP-dependent pyruvate/acetoin dehydrogenase alpha subunit
VVAVYEATRRAVDRARAGEGPSLIECVTMRMHGHAEHDPADYVAKELYEEYAKKDPVELYENVLLKAGVIDDDTVKQVREETRQVAIAARRKSLADPMPDPSNIEDGVYAD